MSLYGWLHIGIILFPLILSFERKITYYKKLPALALSLLIVSTVFIIWDAIATARGDWSFNEEHILGFTLLGLPIEEILFFVTVPYSCLFLYETIKLYIPEKAISVRPVWYYTASALLLGVALFFTDQYYTWTVLLFAAGFFLLAPLLHPVLIQSRNFYIFMAFSYLPFLVVNYILTSVPVVLYGNQAIWGGRFLTIPYEDFFYSFAMIGFWTLFYEFFRIKLAHRK